jgi:2-methylcitrate dehydratase PrpD
LAEDRVVEFIAGIRWEDLPREVQEKARMCVVDNLGALLVGTLTKIGGIASEYARETWPGTGATLFSGGKASAVGAAFANACAANGLDIDDCALYTWGHPGAQIFPVTLAVAEDLGLSGRHLLSGLVVGYEVAFRTARCWHDYRPVYQSCGSWGSVASAAAAAHLIGFPVAQIHHALGIAEYHAPNLPMMRDVQRPAMVKHGIGWGAMTGVISAHLASRGYTGIPTLLGFEQYREWVEDIGRQYILPHGIVWKEYCCCGWAHPALEAIKTIASRNEIPVDSIARIHILAYHEAACLGTRLPATTEEAQFNMPWPVAALLLDGEVGPSQMLEHRLKDPRMRALASKVEVEESEELNSLYRLSEANDPEGKDAAVVSIYMTDGGKIESGLVNNPCYPQPGWDRAKMEEKFRWLAQHLLTPKGIEQVTELAWHLDDVGDVREFTRAVTEGLLSRRPCGLSDSGQGGVS